MILGKNRTKGSERTTSRSAGTIESFKARPMKSTKQRREDESFRLTSQSR